MFLSAFAQSRPTPVSAQLFRLRTAGRTLAPLALVHADACAPAVRTLASLVLVLADLAALAVHALAPLALVLAYAGAPAWYA